MEQDQRNTFFILCIFALAVFLLAIPPNMTGARNPEMLAVFEVDEYAQYPHLVRMLTPGGSAYQSLRNFFVYEHYFYGFPFYFFSAVTLAPLTWFVPDWTEQTAVVVCWLRQFVSVLPMLISILLLTWVITKFRRRRVSIALFLFLAMFPAVVQNHFWWHPDSLSVMLICFVIFFLDKDNLRLSRHFFFAAAFCGMAIGTKYQGVYFALTIPVILLIAVIRLKMPIRKAVASAFLFIIIMAIFIIVSNPLLFLPQERAEIIRTQQLQFEQTSRGTFTENRHELFPNGNLPEPIRKNYAETWFFILCFGGLLIGSSQRDSKQALPYWIIGSYLVTAGAITFSAATSRLHYLLPLALPLLSCYPFLEPLSNPAAGPQKKTERALPVLLAVLFFLQFGINLKTSVQTWQTHLRREADSPSIRFYNELKNMLPEPAPNSNATVKILRDWKVYFPNQPGFAVKMDWEMLTFDQLTAFQPDVILLEQENIREFANPNVVVNAVNPEK